MADAPVVDIDMFSVEAIRNARAVDDGLRELAPAVKLSREDITIIGRHEHVKDGLADWRTFSSTSRPWHDPSSPRPEILLTDDPPRHTHVRAVVARAMSKRALDRWEARFRSDATRIVDTLIERSGQIVDATADISRPFVYKALPDVIGLPEQGREHMEAFGHMVWSTLGPPNELFEEAMADRRDAGRLDRQCHTARESGARQPGHGHVRGRRRRGDHRRRRAVAGADHRGRVCRHHGHDPVGGHPRVLRVPGPVAGVAGRARPGAQRLRREPAVGLAVADGRAHHHHRRAARRHHRFPPASDAGCCSPRPIAIRADGTSPTGSMCGATWPDNWAGASVCTCASGVNWRSSRLTRCCRS